jgi:SAM-dependent methyltransferase
MKSRAEHIEFQREYFNRGVDFFRQPLPEDVGERTRRIVEMAELSSSDRILDVGTGTGVLIQYFLQFSVLPESIVGCDLSSQMLEEARKRYPAVRFIQSDIEELPLSTGTFSKAFFNACFGNMYNPVSTLLRTSKLLETGGKIIISHPLGNDFVRQLKDKEPELVLRLLPSEEELLNWCGQLRLDLAACINTGDFYWVALHKLEQRDDADEQ